MTYKEFEAMADLIYTEYNETHRYYSGWSCYLFTAHDAYVSAANRMSADEICEVIDDAPEYDCDGIDELLQALKASGDGRWADYQNL